MIIPIALLLFAVALINLALVCRRPWVRWFSVGMALAPALVGGVLLWAGWR